MLHPLLLQVKREGAEHRRSGSTGRKGNPYNPQHEAYDAWLEGYEEEKRRQYAAQLSR